jgi:hypothetical protein
VPDAAHAAACVAVRHYRPAAGAIQRLDAALINQEMRHTSVYFFGRFARLRLDGRLDVDLSLLRFKAPEAMRAEWDHYEQIDVVPGGGCLSAAEPGGLSSLHVMRAGRTLSARRPGQAAWIGP